MRSSLSLLLGLRFSYIRRSNSMISIIFIISTTGIALGVAVLIIGLSAMNGFERELNNRILSIIPHGEIELVDQYLNDWQSMIFRIKKISGIIASVPYIKFAGLIEKGAKLQSLQVKGIDPKQESSFSKLPCFIKKNIWSKFVEGKQQIILGEGVAKSLNVKYGDWITIMIPNLNQVKKLMQPKYIRLQVHGILQLSGMLDYNLALVPLTDAQRYLDMGNRVTGIALKMLDPFQAQKLAREAAIVSQSYVHIHSWMNSYGYMYHDIQLIRTIMYLTMILVIGIACFNIISTLITAVKDRSNDIAILRTLGAKDSLIRSIFIWYGLFTGFLGGIIGMVIGVIIAINLTFIIQLLEHLIGNKILIGKIYFINFIPSELYWLDVICVFAIVIALSLIASWYPARRASYIDPVYILKGR